MTNRGRNSISSSKKPRPNIGLVRTLGFHLADSHIMCRPDQLAGPDGTHRLTPLVGGEVQTVQVRRKVVDGTHARTEVPATHAPHYTVAPGVDCIPINALATTNPVAVFRNVLRVFTSLSFIVIKAAIIQTSRTDRANRFEPPAAAGRHPMGAC